MNFKNNTDNLDQHFLVSETVINKFIEISNLTNDVIDEMMGYYNPQVNASKLEKRISKIYEQDEYDEQNEKIHNIIDSSYSVSEALERIMKRD